VVWFKGRKKVNDPGSAPGERLIALTGHLLQKRERKGVPRFHISSNSQTKIESESVCAGRRGSPERRASRQEKKKKKNKTQKKKGGYGIESIEEKESEPGKTEKKRRALKGGDGLASTAQRVRSAPARNR